MSCSREREERPAVGKEKVADVQKKVHLVHTRYNIQGSPSGCGRLGAAGVSRVENGEHRIQAFLLCIWACVRLPAVVPLLLVLLLLLCRRFSTVIWADAFEIQRKRLGDELLLPG